jgi:hypothetical protein
MEFRENKRFEMPGMEFRISGKDNFFVNHFLDKLFKNCEEKITTNFKMILDNRLWNEIWDFFNFYDRICEQRVMIDNYLKIPCPITLILNEITVFLIKNPNNYFTGIEIMEKLFSFIKSKPIKNISEESLFPRFRNPSDGYEYINNTTTNSQIENKVKNTKYKNKIHEVKEYLRNSIRAEQLGAVLLFKSLESNFPLNELKIKLKETKMKEIYRILSLLNTIVTSDLVANTRNIKEQNDQLDMILRRVSKDEDEDQFGSFMFRKPLRLNKNLPIAALKERKLASVVDHKCVANFINKLGSIGCDELEFYSMIFSNNGLLRHKQTMKSVLDNMFYFVKKKNLEWKYLKSLLEIFEIKIMQVQNRLDIYKKKYKFISDKLLNNKYRSSKNKTRAKEVLGIYKKRFVKLTRFMRLIVGHKRSVFKSIFQTMFKKSISPADKLSSEHVKTCLKSIDITSKQFHTNLI